MKSTDLLHLQQQFLKALHGGNNFWLLNQLVPAKGFNNPSQVLSIYLERAQSRTIDPLHNIFPSIRWLLGDDIFKKLVAYFYAKAPGEPLEPQRLAEEFVGILGLLESAKEDTIIKEIIEPIKLVLPEKCEPYEIIISAGLLDWNCSRALLAPRRRQKSSDDLHQALKHRAHLWARPRLERGSIICSSNIDLVNLKECVRAKNSIKSLKTFDKPHIFIIYTNTKEAVCIKLIDEITAKLIDHCDGTHAFASLMHEGRINGYTKTEVYSIIYNLIDNEIIAEFQA